MTGPRRHPFAVTPVEVLLAEVDGDVRLRRALGPGARSVPSRSRRSASAPSSARGSLS